VAVARLQAQVLDNIARVANGRPENCDAMVSTAMNSSASTSITMEDNNNNQNNKDKSSTPVGTEDEKRKKTSLAVAMAEASLLSQKAAVQEQANFRAMLELQREENEVKKNEMKFSNEEAKLARDKHIQAMQLSYEERSAVAEHGGEALSRGRSCRLFCGKEA
jgi:hypothetical protein